ncbi:hypothetical protein [Halobellus ruber]|uniref:hypothetical protein n=1 Tax=Halobellus ruber TaxID=2761102 RepID=UPI001FE6DEA0|nr:hypothetical protein [Halobellus ruber]
MPAKDSPVRVVVRRRMNDHGTLTVEVGATNETRHVCAYATPELRRRLASLQAGTELPLSMSRIGVRANVWRAVGVAEERSARSAGVTSEKRTIKPI